MAAVKREDGKVWIEGVPPLGWGTDRECTFAGALEAALAVTEHPWKYADIMGLSGLAFRVRWYQGHAGERWCPSSPVGEFPEEIAAVQKATGWQLRVECLMGQDDANMARFAPDVVASIDAGRPVPAYGQHMNMGVAYGYEDGGERLLMFDYFKGDEPVAVPASELGPMLILLGDHGEPMPPRAALTEALGIAVRNAQREPAPSEKGEYLYGDAALAAWADDLGDTAGLSEEQRGNLFFVSWWNFSSLCDARCAAVRFLRDGAASPDSEAREALERAAALYEQEARQLGAVFGSKDAFLGPWSGKSVKDWSADVRQREQAILAEARELDADAIAEIEKALVL